MRERTSQSTSKPPTLRRLVVQRVASDALEQSGATLQTGRRLLDGRTCSCTGRRIDIDEKGAHRPLETLLQFGENVLAVRTLHTPISEHWLLHLWLSAAALGADDVGL